MTVAVAPQTSLLSEALPDFDINEIHSREVAAPPAVAWDAFRSLRPLEVRVLAPLMAIRVLPALLSRRNSLQYSRADALIDLFLRNGFLELGSRPGEEFAAGAIGRFWSLTGNDPLPIASPEEFAAFDEPGFAKAAFNFTLEPSGAGTLARTETRIVGTDPGATRLFGRYWRVIYPGSALIRISWLNAVRRRAERL